MIDSIQKHGVATGEIEEIKKVVEYAEADLKTNKKEIYDALTAMMKVCVEATEAVKCKAEDNWKNLVKYSDDLTKAIADC